MDKNKLEKICFESLKQSIDKSNDILKFNLSNLDFGSGRIFVIGWGKSVDPFIKTIISIIPKKQLVGCKYLSLNSDYKKGKIERMNATHPLTSEKNTVRSRIILDFLKNAKEEDTIIIISTGGGSSMFEVLNSNISLKQLKEVTFILLKNNVDCRLINFIRRCCSEVKGGKLLNHMKARNILTFVVSDDVLTRKNKDCVMHVASGVTKKIAISEERKNKNVNQLESIGITKIIPKSVFLKDNKIPVKNVKHIVLFDNWDLMKILQKNLSHKGFKTRLRTMPYFEESRKVAKKLINEFSMIIKEEKKPFAYICGGESTVDVKGDGKGGRVQELVGYSLKQLSKIPNSHIIGIGSDGRDYLKGIAGAYAKTDTYKKINFRIKNYLNNNNTYFLHKKLGNLIKSPEYTLNVGDFIILLKE